ncbi:histone H1-delta-like [Liolophura sinensis]|uniref:histone H1-delta-like n=1 Tax=Liolophura sinensis TaxID=3198878 RepID=UPI0031584102
MDIDEELAIISGTKLTESKKTAQPHPKYRDMVIKALTALQEKGGSSRLKILRYIVSQFNVVDEARANVHLKLALKNAVTDGTLIQSNGTGAAGSFRLSDATVSAQSKGKKSTQIAGKPKKKELNGSMKTNNQSVKKVPRKPKLGTQKEKAPATKNGVTKDQARGVTNKGKANTTEKGATKVNKAAGRKKSLAGKKDACRKSIKGNYTTPSASYVQTNSKKSTSKKQTACNNSKIASAKKVPKAKQSPKTKSTTTTKRITRNSMNKKS